MTELFYLYCITLIIYTPHFRSSMRTQWAQGNQKRDRLCCCWTVLLKKKNESFTHTWSHTSILILFSQFLWEKAPAPSLVFVKGNRTIYPRLAGLVGEIICGSRALSITGPGKLSARCGVDSLIKGGKRYERHFGLFPGNVIVWLTPERKHFNYSFR